MGTSEKTVKKQKGHLFKPGQSGNPAGKPKGALNKATMAAQTLLDGESEALTRKAVKMALGGNIQALRLCIERLVPPRKERAIALDLPDFDGVESLPGMTAALLREVAKGELTVGEASALSTLVANHGRALELVELEKRISALEGRKP